MHIGYIHLDYGEWQNGSYNVQEIGLGKAMVQLGHSFTIVYWVGKNDERCGKTVKIQDVSIIIDEELLIEDIEYLLGEGLIASANGGNKTLVKKLKQMVEIAFQIDENYPLPDKKWLYVSDIYVPDRRKRVGLVSWPDTKCHLTVRIAYAYCNK